MKERSVTSVCYGRTDESYDVVIYYFTRMISAVLFFVRSLKIKLEPRLAIISPPRLKTVFSHIDVTWLITLGVTGGKSIIGISNLNLRRRQLVVFNFVCIYTTQKSFRKYLYSLTPTPPPTPRPLNSVAKITTR
jgi:hypothetical protein